MLENILSRAANSIDEKFVQKQPSSWPTQFLEKIQILKIYRIIKLQWYIYIYTHTESKELVSIPLHIYPYIGIYAYIRKKKKRHISGQMRSCAQLYKMEINQFIHKHGFIHVIASNFATSYAHGSMCICVYDKSNKCQRQNVYESRWMQPCWYIHNSRT